jgi:glyoxylase-like metal-dependent hydrolase (beta-lactamase superfamily II)
MTFILITMNSLSEKLEKWGWFMINEIMPDIFLLEIPLPGNPLRALNSYLVRGESRNLLVDTGFNWPECREAQIRGMEELGVPWEDVDFFITHIHADHSGLVYDLAHRDSRVYMSRADADIMRACMTENYWVAVNRFYTSNGFPVGQDRNQARGIHHYISGSDIDFTYTSDGYRIDAGRYSFICISTPGHTPGHMCLYEPDRKFFISGDHILEGITSNIASWLGTGDPLGLYLASLDKVAAMDIDLILPGHRELIRDSHRRIAELKSHHDRRLDEVLNIIQSRGMTAFDAASRMHWDLSYSSWDDFPDFQKWFATGEAISHLEHLAAVHRVIKTEMDGKFFYSAA